MRLENWHGFVVVRDLDVPPGGAVQVEYRLAGRWVAACVMPNLTEEELQSPCNGQDWNWATQFHGFVHGYQIRPGLGPEHLPGAPCSGTGSPALGLCSP